MLPCRRQQTAESQSRKRAISCYAKAVMNYAGSSTKSASSAPRKHCQAEMKSGTRQKKQLKEAEEIIMAARITDGVAASRDGLAAPAPTEKQKSRSLLDNV